MEVNSEVVEDQLYVDGNINTKTINDSNKKLLNEKASDYTITVEPNVESIVTTGLTSINKNNSMSSVHSLVQLGGGEFSCE